MSTAIDERDRRIAQNEAVFRAVNERMRDLNEAFASLSGTMRIVCECGNVTCAEQLTIAPEDYEQIRSDATWFAIIPGHVSAGVENVVFQRDGYNIVQKRPGVPAEQARSSDART